VPVLKQYNEMMVSGVSFSGQNEDKHATAPVMHMTGAVVE
jgi:hypothetical protein